jgi:Amt family ammonium transporter
MSGLSRAIDGECWAGSVRRGRGAGSWLLGAAAGLLVPAACAWAQNAGASFAARTAAPKPDSGDTAWMLVATALVLCMTLPGLALFYGGLVRAKNVLSVFMHCLYAAIIVSVIWVILGYSVAFGKPVHPEGFSFCGGLTELWLEGPLESAKTLAPTIPPLLFVAYQLTFAIITPALIAGAFAERMRFMGFAVFTALWSLLIYAPLAHWVWGGGWIATHIGALDFAGGTVVHISSGVAALVCAVYLGKRKGYGVEPMPPHNLPMTVMGAGLLWVGWFGFNAGSALASGALAATALINTHTAAAAAGLGWMLMEFGRSRQPTVLGAASGAVAGLVAITPAAGFVTPMSAILIGGLAGAVCYLAVSFKPRFGYDDALDVVGVHFVGGTLGALLTGVFATREVNPAIESLALGTPGGLVDGHPQLIVQQALAVLVTVVYAGAGTLILLLVTNLFCKLRADDGDEQIGMDLSQHTERGYALGGGEAMAAAAHAGAPRSADAPPPAYQRYTVHLRGVDNHAMIARWSALCQTPASERPEEFDTVYDHLSTVRNGYFRFRGDARADRERVRAAIESLFKDLGPNVRATLE